MKNAVFTKCNTDAKKKKLKEVLINKIGSRELDLIKDIIENIDLNHQYSIIVTRKPEKFKNVIMTEKINTPNRIVESFTHLVLGEFTSGHFSNQNGKIVKYTSSLKESENACAIKRLIEYDINVPEKETFLKNYLIIYISKGTIISEQL